MNTLNHKKSQGYAHDKSRGQEAGYFTVSTGLLAVLVFGLGYLFGWWELPFAIAVISCESLVGLFGKHPFRKVAKLWLKNCGKTGN